MSFEHDLQDFLKKSDTYYQFSQDFFKQFENGGEGDPRKRLLVIISNTDSINHDFLSNIQSFSNEIKTNHQVGKVLSIINQPLFVFTSMGRYPYKLFHLNEPEKIKEDLKIANGYTDIKNRYISKDWKSTLLYVQLNEGANVDSILNVKENISSLASKYPFESVKYFNSDLTNHYIMKKLSSESAVLTQIAAIIVLLILIYFCRSFMGVIIPLSVVIMCVIWILGLIAFLGIPLNVLTIAIPVIVGVISLSDVIHIISRFSEEESEDKLQKLKLTQKDMLKAIVLTSVTTSLGFLSLIPSDIQVFIEFGFFSTLGVLFAFILAYWFLPILLYYSKEIKLKNTLTKVTPKKLYPKVTIVVSTLVIGLCIIGVIKVKNDSYIYDDIEAKDEASIAISSIAQEFYGIRDLSLAITLSDTAKSLTSYDVIQKLDQLQDSVNKIYHLKNYTSLVTLIKQMNRAKNGGRSAYFSIPDDENDFKRVTKTINKNKRFFTLDQFISKNKQSTFIYSKINDPGSYIIKKNNERLKRIVNKHFADLFTVIPTGGSHILDQTNVSVSRTMILSLSFIMLIIMIIIAVMFKSIKLGLLSLIPNMMPILVIVGVVGWFDLGLSVTITIVFTIVFGIAVDDTIHFLSRYQIEMKKGIPKNEVIENCIKTSGGAISLTTITLIAGFGTLILSDFHANFTTGLLVSIGLVVALFCDLFLLPLILLWITKTKK